MGQQSVGGDGSAFSRPGITTDAYLALWDELAGKRAEVRTRVYQESLLTALVMRWSVALAQACAVVDVCCVTLQAVDTGLSTVLLPGPKRRSDQQGWLQRYL